MLENHPLSLKHTAKNLYRHLIMLGCSAVLAACAMSPQTIVVKPDIKAPAMPIGHGRQVSVETNDERRDTTLGTLGGVYHSAYLTTDERMSKSVTQEAVTVLQSWDFVAVPGSLAHTEMARFTISILNIDYQRPTTTVGGNVVVKCRIAVKVEMGSETYSGEYQSQRSEQVAVMGTVDSNRRIVNETINQALNQLFKDQKLQRFMAR